MIKLQMGDEALWGFKEECRHFNKELCGSWSDKLQFNLYVLLTLTCFFIPFFLCLIFLSLVFAIALCLMFCLWRVDVDVCGLL